MIGVRDEARVKILRPGLRGLGLEYVTDKANSMPVGGAKHHRHSARFSCENSLICT